MRKNASVALRVAEIASVALRVAEIAAVAHRATKIAAVARPFAPQRRFSPRPA